ISSTSIKTYKKPIIKAYNDGTVRFNELRTVQALDGSWIVLNKNGSISVHNAEGRELERHNVVIGSMISVPNGAHVKGPTKDTHAKIVRDQHHKHAMERHAPVHSAP